MGEEKRNRITAAITVNAIILIFILAAVLIYQILTISVLKKRKVQLWDEYYQLQQQLKEAEELEDRLRYDEQLKKIIEELAKLGEKTPNSNSEAGYTYIFI